METTRRAPVKIFRRTQDPSPSRKRLRQEDVELSKKVQLLERQNAILRCEVNRLNIITHNKEAEKKRDKGVFGWLKFLDLGETEQDQKVREALTAESA